MPLSSAAVGDAPWSVSVPVDARWTMNYAAGLGETDQVYFDTSSPGLPVAHPMFSVAVEWSVGERGGLPGASSLTPDEAVRGVHAAHEIQLHRPLVPPSEAQLVLRVEGIRARRAGAEFTLRTDARDKAGPLWTSWTTSVFRDVTVEGPNRDSGELPPPVERLPDGWLGSVEQQVHVPANAAHVYDSCSGIFNPIHTDVAVARAAGLPGPILQGTATLGLAVSACTRAFAGGRPQAVRRIYGRFVAMVLLPNELTVSAGPPDAAGNVRFRVFEQSGECVVDDGLVEISHPAYCNS